MKKKLLKLFTTILIVNAFLFVENSMAQVTPMLETFNYPIGDQVAGKSGGSGWSGPWFGNVFNSTSANAGTINGSVTPSVVMSGACLLGRYLANPIVNNTPASANQTFWLAFYWKELENNESNGPSGFQLWNSANQLCFSIVSRGGYSTNTGGFQSQGSPFSVPAGGNTYVEGLAEHYYLVKLKLLGNGEMRSFYWVDYVGSEEPAENDARAENEYFYTNATDIKTVVFQSVTNGGNQFDDFRMENTFFPKNAVLSLKLASLNAKQTINGNLVSWVTASTDNVNSIIVLRRDDKGVFSPISSELSKSTLSFLDKSPLKGVNYYKLSYKDNQGKSHIDNLQTFVEGFESIVKFYPNPVKQGVLNISTKDEFITSISLFDSAGKQVISVKDLGSNSAVIDIKALDKGFYVLEVRGSSNTVVEKIVVE